MKMLWRRGLMFILSICIFCFTLVAITNLYKAIQNDTTSLQALYEHLNIWGEFRRRENGEEADSNGLSLVTIDAIVERGYMRRFSTYVQCPITIDGHYAMAYGISDPSHFLEKRKGSIVEECKEDFLESDTRIAYVSKAFSETMGLEIGDTIIVHGFDYMQEGEPIEVTIGGIYTMDESSMLYEEDILLPYRSMVNNYDFFFSSLLVHTYMRYQELFYWVNPSFYPTYLETVKADMVRIAGDEWRVITNDKDIYQIALPLRNKIRNSKRIFWLSTIALSLLNAILWLFWGKSFRRDCMVARLCGQKGIVIWVSHMARFTLFLILLAIGSYVLKARLTFIVVGVGLSVLWLGIIFGWYCAMNLYRLYSLERGE